MSNSEKYNDAFVQAFGVGSDKLNSDLVFQSIQAWDSVGHMQLIAFLEDAFDIMFDTDDIINFSSYDIGKELILKYGVEI